MLKVLLKIVGKLFSFVGGVLVTLFVVGVIWVGYHFDDGLDIAKDVSKRLRSPNHELTAFLISSNSGSERVISIEMLTNPSIVPTAKYSFYGSSLKPIFSKYFDPDLTVNLHENIEWSADSSLLVLTVDRHNSQPFKWAYDFKNDSEITDVNEIESLWLQRNQIPDSNEVTSNNRT